MEDVKSGSIEECDKKIAEMEKTLKATVGNVHNKILGDLIQLYKDSIKVQEDRIKGLERDLADALNPFSSRLGALVHIENGELYYRVDGKFILCSQIAQAMISIERFASQSLQKE